MSLLNLLIIKGMIKIAIDIISVKYAAKYSSYLCTETENNTVSKTATNSNIRNQELKDWLFGSRRHEEIRFDF